MANELMKRCSSVVIGELQIEFTGRKHLTPARMVLIQEWDDSKGWGGCGVSCRGQWCAQVLVKQELACDPVAPLAGTYLRKTKCMPTLCLNVLTAALLTAGTSPKATS